MIFFSFSTLNMSFQYFWLVLFLVRTQLLIISLFLYVLFFSFCFQYFSCLCFSAIWLLYLEVILFLCKAFLLSFLDLLVNVFHQIWDYFGHFTLNVFLSTSLFSLLLGLQLSICFTAWYCPADLGDFIDLFSSIFFLCNFLSG